jgi:uncharacterized protein YqgC (DUF456 family)
MGSVDPLTVDIIITVLAAVAIVVGLTGIVLPILPGSITIVIASLVWAIVLGGPEVWIAFALIVLFSAAAMTCTYVFTGRKLKQNEVPTWPIVVGVVAGVIGIFVIPFAGLFVGFLAGLFGAEWYRLKDPNQALSSSWVAIKALGIGMALELTLGLLSFLTFAIATTVHSLTL